MLDRKVYQLEIKATAEDGTFTGIASKYGVEDLGNDVISKGAFTKTILERPTVAVLWQHSASEVIGTGTVREDGDNIIIDGQLDMDDPLAKKAIGKMRKGLIRGLSIGFESVKVTWEETKDKFIRHIDELKLWEVSIVTFPMLPEAVIQSVKAQRELDIKALKANQGTPPEPPLADEPPKGTTEPVRADHSWIDSMEAPKWKT